MPRRIADISNAFRGPFLLWLCLNWPLNVKGKQYFGSSELRENQNVFMFETMRMTGSASNPQAAYIFCSSGHASVFWVHTDKRCMQVSLPGLVLNYVHLCRTWSLGSLQPYKIVANKLFCELAVEDYRITPTKFLIYCNRFLHQVWKYTLRSLPLFHNIQNPCYAQAEQKIFSIS